MQETNVRKVEFVMKISKFCNLRCRYCYEYKQLDERAAMSRAQLQTAYQTIKAYFSERDSLDNKKTLVQFDWHGGEPLLIEPDFYRKTFEDQREVFRSSNVLVRNVVQTNLMLLGEQRIELLRNEFDAVGVSIDIFGGLRVNIAGVDSQAHVLQNMDRLRMLNIPFGAIVVLTKANMHRIREIYQFFATAGIPFRVLPLFKTAFDGQHSDYDITSVEILHAFRSMVDLWLEDDEASAEVEPIKNQIHIVLRYLKKDFKPQYYNKRNWMPVILVNTNGDCYSDGDPYGDTEWSIGNIFTQTLQQIFESVSFDKSALAAEKRMAQNCINCCYFGSCSGYEIAEGHHNSHENSANGRISCTVEKGILEYIESKIRTRGRWEKDGLFHFNVV